ncbi:MAG TPA: amino acid permease [Pseudolabrys sp.]|uniref:APC family permease n=1 Tax=Pseudolabrys sp. TaxID=1960880 RepID=UPI002DDCE980|nr:amino acid permease [Pseudolabrys sp.]HEV2629383.1 amino acid permease [Pseudolabrys sp.]
MDSALTPALRRRLGLPLLFLYGVGITVGAGIYVLIGAVAGHAGTAAPWAFALAAAAMALTVGSYAELSTRFPVSAGEAAYVRAALNSRLASTAIGLLTMVIGIVASATVALGSAGYIGQFVAWPTPLIVAGVLIGLGLVAAWGILESVLLASLFTLIEVGGLVYIIAAGVASGVSLAPVLAPPPLEAHALAGIGYAALLAFFAFIGFEDLANVVEEAKVPHRDIPRAMVLTLIVTTVLYLAVAAIAVAAVPAADLARSPAPLALVLRTLTGASPLVISAIAIVATLNTILAQLTMAARVIYGMARQGDLPALFGHVHPKTATPLVATGFIVAATLALALTVPFERLAEGTSLATLVVFATVNFSLLRLRARKAASPHPHVRVPLWVPAAGLATCLAMLAAALLA